MKITSIFQLTAAVAFGIIAINTSTMTPDHSQDGARHNRFIMPRLMMAYNGNDEGCVPDPHVKNHPHSIAFESLMNA